MKKCEKCGKETNDYKYIKELDETWCQECIENDIEIMRDINDPAENDTAYDYGYDGNGW